ncbi:MAG TPA: ATPase, T2SS/T4P/T4SS family, partial [Myxococcales bacterium]|nr:ATPase, T2SS/T4P/T4SS family [Myxococcales bacterium]
MPNRASPPTPTRLPEASVAPPPLLDGIVRVKVPPDKIQPFLAKTPLFRNAPKEVIAKAAALFDGLECADGSELITAGKINDGLGLLFSGKAQVLVPSAGGELLPVEDLGPGDHFGEAGALLGRPSPAFVIASAPSRVLWLPAAVFQGMLGNVPAVGEAIARRLAERMISFAAVEKHAAPPELVTGIEEQLQQAVDSARHPEPVPAPAPAVDMAGVIPFAELRDFDLSPSVLTMVPGKLIRSFRLLPVKLSGNVLTVAMVNPRDNAALAELRRTLQTVQIVPVAIGLEEFNSALVRLKLLDDAGPKRAGSGPRINPDSFLFETVAEQDREKPDARAVGDEAIRLVNRIIAAGLEREASDIHIEPTAQGFRVRYRVNGVLLDWNEPLPAGASLKGITARIKVLAGLDITERRLPQDGRIGLTAGKRDIDLRVSALPANRGEKIVMRVLEAAGSTRALEQIFFDPSVVGAARK